MQLKLPKSILSLFVVEILLVYTIVYACKEFHLFPDTKSRRNKEHLSSDIFTMPVGFLSGLVVQHLRG